MVDREKAVKGLECCTKGNTCMSDCPYFKEVPMANGECITALQADALALLKEQEPKMVKLDEDSVHCPSCGNELFTYPRQKYCDECGQAVKWE